MPVKHSSSDIGSSILSLPTHAPMTQLDNAAVRACRKVLEAVASDKISIMPNPRRYTDEQLRNAIATSTNWSQVMVAIGKKPGSGTRGVKAVADSLNLDTSHFFYARSFKPVAGIAVPFGNSVRHGGQSGLSIAARWFLDRGYIVSLPLEPAPYDLVTESDDGLKRIQVKTTRRVERNGRYKVILARMLHDAKAPRNANGNRRRVSYKAEDVDYFFVITPTSAYLIPIDVVAGKLGIVLDEKYAAFVV